MDSDSLRCLTKLKLLDLSFGASFFQLLLGCFSICLRNAFFQWLRCAVNQVFSFFQAEAGQSAHYFDDVDLVGATIFKNYIIQLTCMGSLNCL